MGLIFLVVLLIGMVWLNKGVFGFGSNKCNWMSADKPGEDGSMKWMCQTCDSLADHPLKPALFLGNLRRIIF